MLLGGEEGVWVPVDEQVAGAERWGVSGRGLGIVAVAGNVACFVSWSLLRTPFFYPDRHYVTGILPPLPQPRTPHPSRKCSLPRLSPLALPFLVPHVLHLEV